MFVIIIVMINFSVVLIVCKNLKWFSRCGTFKLLLTSWKLQSAMGFRQAGEDFGKEFRCLHMYEVNFVVVDARHTAVSKKLKCYVD